MGCLSRATSSMLFGFRVSRIRTFPFDVLLESRYRSSSIRCVLATPLRSFSCELDTSDLYEEIWLTTADLRAVKADEIQHEATPNKGAACNLPHRKETYMFIATFGGSPMPSHESSAFSTSSRTVVYKLLPGCRTAKLSCRLPHSSSLVFMLNRVQNSFRHGLLHVFVSACNTSRHQIFTGTMIYPFRGLCCPGTHSSWLVRSHSNCTRSIACMTPPDRIWKRTATPMALQRQYTANKKQDPTVSVGLGKLGPNVQVHLNAGRRSAEATHAETMNSSVVRTVYTLDCHVSTKSTVKLKFQVAHIVKACYVFILRKKLCRTLRLQTRKIGLHAHQGGIMFRLTM